MEYPDQDKETANDAAHEGMLSNVELERPTADSDRALCAHNNPGAHSAPHRLSRPLQALVRCIVFVNYCNLAHVTVEHPGKSMRSHRSICLQPAQSVGRFHHIPPKGQVCQRANRKLVARTLLNKNASVRARASRKKLVVGKCGIEPAVHLTVSLSGRCRLRIARHARTIVLARTARLISSHGRSKRWLDHRPRRLRSIASCATRAAFIRLRSRGTMFQAMAPSNVPEGIRFRTTRTRLQ